MFERFTETARRVMVLAQEEARLLNHSFIGTEHLLLGLLHGDGVAATALRQLGISLEAVREKVEETVGAPAKVAGGAPPFTPRAKKVLELSLREALQLGHNYIGTEHILLGLVREGDGVGAHVLADLGADRSRVRQRVIDLLAGGGLDVGPLGDLGAPTARPRCPVCSASLTLTYVDLDAQSANEGETGAGVVPVRAFHCSLCGATLAVIPQPIADLEQ